VNCLEASVQKWLGELSPNLLKDFERFSQFLKNHFESSVEKEKCIICGRKTETIICPYCYTKEVFHFLSLKDEKLAESFIKTFNFDFHKVGYAAETILTKNLSSIIITEKEESSDINICENCGNQSEDLREVNGSFICEVCEDESRS
jgi:recombinational DNA repair protein RecR